MSLTSIPADTVPQWLADYERAEAKYAAAVEETGPLHCPPDKDMHAHDDALAELAHRAVVLLDGARTIPMPEHGNSLPPEACGLPEHIFLVGVSVTAPTRERAEDWLHRALPRPSTVFGADGSHVDSWWVAEDGRRDRSDCCSAVFIPGDYNREAGHGSIPQADAARLLQLAADNLDAGRALDAPATYAAQGHAPVVQIVWTTDAENKPLDDPEDYPSTYHGPFASDEEAQEWIEAYPEDTDIDDFHVFPLNLVRPAAPLVSVADREHIENLHDAIHHVGEAWESGDLAAAVTAATFLLPDDYEGPADETEHVDYPHQPGRLYDCPACEARCHCTPGDAECIYSGEHNGTAAPEED